jgi:exopolysaccharide biosynthesis protein
MTKLLCRISYSIVAITLLAVSPLLAQAANATGTTTNGAADQAAPAKKPELIAVTPITAGAVLKEYYWDNDRGQARIYVTEVDLNNPYIELGVISGQGLLTQRLNVTAMARNTGAVAAINGDFYNMRGEGVPIGPVVNDGRLVVSPSKLVGWHGLGVTAGAHRRAHIEAFTFDGKVTAFNGAEFSLSGLNKTPYWEQPGGSHSHVHTLHLYNDLWGGKTRGHDSYTTPTEVLVRDGKLIDISLSGYFDFSVPEGAYILRGHGEAARYLENNFRVGDPVQLEYAMTPNLNWSMVLGGYSLLVDEGKAVPLPREVLTSLDGLRARSAAGISKDGKTLYLVGGEGRTETSKGLHLSNLALFFEEIGAWKAMNLDGGGSTTMVARPLGEWDAKRVFATEQTTERLVANALGIYSTAPQGKLAGLIISGNQVMLVGEAVSFTLKAYDQYYNPLDPNQLPVHWTRSGELGSWQGNVFTANRPGVTELIAGVNSISARLPVEVAGRKEVSRLVLAANTGNTSGQIGPGQEVPLTLTIQTLSGKTRQVPANLVDWQFYNLTGEVTPGGRLIIREAGSGGRGIVVARYQGYSAPLFLAVSQEQQLAAFDRPEAPVSLELTVGKREMSANGTITEMDVAPRIINGRTLVPVRFVSQALSGGVLWDGKTRNVTVIRGANWIDLWVGDNLMVVNGQGMQLEVPPELIRDRTMLPLRAVAEVLGLTVEWNPETRGITLRN